MWLSVRPETEVLFREAKQTLERERGERLDEDAVLEAICRGYLARSTPRDDHSVPRGSERSSADESNGHGAAPYRVAVTVCTECKRGWQHGGGAVAEMSPAAVERAECDAQWIGDLDSDDVERARQSIPPATRRKVLHRDQERCQAPSCSCHSNLDVHHIVHREHGGTNEMSNLITLCESHHQAHHEGTLVVERARDNITFRREGKNRFTRATREIATRQALRERGYSREQIAKITARTISHVGESDLSASQWLAIALSYAKDDAS